MPLKFVWHRRGDSCKYLEVIVRDRTKTPQLFTMYHKNSRTRICCSSHEIYIYIIALGFLLVFCIYFRPSHSAAFPHYTANDLGRRWHFHFSTFFFFYIFRHTFILYSYVTHEAENSLPNFSPGSHHTILCAINCMIICNTLTIDDLST